MDKILLALSIIMFVFGLFMILDASSMRSFIDYGTNNRFFFKQLIILIISLFASIFTLFFATKKYKKYIIPVYVFTVALLIYLLCFGEYSNGARSWIYIGPFGLQPSEIAKLVIIVFTAVYYKANQKLLHKFVPAIIPLIAGAVLTGLTLLQPDGGTGLILFFITIILFFISPVSNKNKLRVVVIGAGFILIAFLLTVFGMNFFTKTQLSRFTFLEPCTRYQESTGFQVCNGYIAINNGKLISISPGNSMQKYLYLPEAYTDFIFPIIVEEFGLISGIVIILIYMLIIYRIIYQARRCTNIGNALICYGVASYIFLHVIINLVGVLGLLPLTGVPLPFLSYGGSFALTLAISLAIIQRISIENYNEAQKKLLNN
jgi:cell division protein FtsW